MKEEEKKVSGEIEEMLAALGDPTPKDPEDKGDEGDEETAEQITARELKEAEEAELSDEEKATKRKEEDDTEAERLAEEEKRKGETEEQKKEREDKEEADRKVAEGTKEKKALDKIEEDKKVREKDDADRLQAEEDAKKNAEPLKLEDQDFIGDLDLDELTRDKVALNKILNSVYSKGVNDSKKLATEGIPDIVKHNLTLLTSLKEASDNFYKENADLTPFKKVVAAVFEDIAAKNPDKKYSELMNLVAPEARKRLELSKQAVKAEKGSGDGEGKPRLHGVKGGLRQTPLHKPNKTALENEISEMNKSIGR